MDEVLDIQQNVGDIGGNFTKSITIESGGSDMGDVEAVIDLTYNIFQYIPELIFVSLYGLTMYAAILWIAKYIKKHD
jgi:hypothetical protein